MTKIKELSDVPAIRNYLNRVGAEPRSLKTAVVKQTFGKYWRDIAIIKFEKDGTVKCDLKDYAPTNEEKQAIIEEIVNFEWPEMQPLHSIINPPQMIREAKPEDIFVFKNLEKQIVMVQVRKERKGNKNYVPWTYFDDGTWRPCEPDGKLPLWGIENLEDHTTVFIHEGAKSARKCHEMVAGVTPEDRLALANCPWGLELSGAAHVGWIGGALSPHRTDWGILAKSGIKRAYIVADNDKPGKSAITEISKHLHIPTFSIEFTGDFPPSFDLGDEFPDKMFSDIGGERIYIGPAFRDCLHPATWATDPLPMSKAGGRPSYTLRESFKGLWAYVEEVDAFICTEMPDIMRSEPVLNKALAGFSHVNDTCRLINKAYEGRNVKICYSPDNPNLLITNSGTSAINMHVPTTIKSRPGDATPFINFMNYLFVHDSERYQVMRWVATLIARPDVHMSYGMLLVSEKQGVGKTTLGSSILAPLVGVNNVSFPSETDIYSPFNSWVANRRLAIVSEIYSGASWKAYNVLKSLITDRDISVNRKYMREYRIDNWCHIFASSNSMRALKMEDSDRRWFYPEVTEVSWSREEFIYFRSWLASGGLSIIKHWAENFGDYVMQSETAPMTEKKKELIEGSRSEAQIESMVVAGSLNDWKYPAAMSVSEILKWIKGRIPGRVYDNENDIKKVMKNCNIHVWKDRIKYKYTDQYFVMNQKLYMMCNELGKDKRSQVELIRNNVISCDDVVIMDTNDHKHSYGTDDDAM